MKEYWDVFDYKTGDVVKAWEQNGIQCLIKRGHASYCAYFGVPILRPLDFYGRADKLIECHWGITFSEAGHKKMGEGWEEGFWWYGWDYGHCTDAFAFEYEEPMLKIREEMHRDDPRYDRNERLKELATRKHWTVKEVEEDMMTVFPQFLIAMRHLKLLKRPSLPERAYHQLRYLFARLTTQG